MRLAFEDVSYSYEGGEAKKKRGRRKKDAARQADWGNAPDAVWALRDVTFTVEPGEFFGVAGHTGSGKSTLIQHMNGLVHPTCGRVLADGRDLAEKGVATEVRRQVGLVFQYPENQLFANTVYDDVAFGPRNMGLGAEEVDRRVREGLALVGLSFDELAERSPFDLSGGQQRRVAFAGVLAMEPEVLVLDEPVAGLDPLSREEFLGLIRELHAGGRTIVMVSHSMEDLAALSDRILVLSEGRAVPPGHAGRGVRRCGGAEGRGPRRTGARGFRRLPARGRLYAGARPLRRAHPGRRYRRPTCGHPGGRRARCGGRLRGVAGCRRRRRGWWRRCLIAPSSASTGPRTRSFTPWIPG